MKINALHKSIWLSVFALCLSLNSLAQDKGLTVALNSESKTKALPKFPAKNDNFKTIKWLDLIPKDDLDALMNPPSYVTDLEDGALEDKISSQLQNTIEAAADDRYQQALVSTKVIPDFNEKNVRIPGFIVPLEHNEKQEVTQFFLVPFFGACIHVPPPPPNQIIFVNHPKGLKVDELYRPFWISGQMKTSLVENDVAVSAYSIELENYEFYEE